MQTDLAQYCLLKNRDSIVTLINSQNSLIKSIEEDEYVYKIFQKINDYFDIDIFN